MGGEGGLGGGVLLEEGQWHDFEGAGVGGGEGHGRGDSGEKGFLPTRGAHAPTVAGLQAGEIVVGHRRGEVIARRKAEGEELGRHFDADGVAAVVFGARVALAVAKETCERLERARFERATEDVERGRRNHGSERGQSGAGCKVGRGCRLDKESGGRTLE